MSPAQKLYCTRGLNQEALAYKILLLAAHYPQEYHTQGSATFNSPLPPPAPPSAWNVPYLRNPLFTRRDELLN